MDILLLIHGTCRSITNPDQNTAIERHLQRFRLMAAQAEAEAFIASKFAEAGRPLPESSGVIRTRDADLLSGLEDLDPYPLKVRLAFLGGAVGAGAAMTVLWWLIG